MSSRVKGYHYVVDENGVRHRVYNKRTKPKKRVIRGSGPYVVKDDAAFEEPPSLYQKYRRSKFVKYMNKTVPKGTFSSFGNALLGPVGGAAGSALASIAGFGAYTLKSNSLMLSEGTSPPYMHAPNSNALIRHREYIADVISNPAGATFTNQAYPINPALPSSFPWLSALAQQYEQYRIKGMVFEFKSMYADAVVTSATSASLGYVIMATNYNSVMPQFASKQAMDNTEYTTSSKPSCSFYHPIECERFSMPTSNLYTRSGAPAANTDLRMYDLGLFQIASGGIEAGSAVLGELWVTYEIELMKPISTTAAGSNVLSDHFRLTGPGSDVYGSASERVDGSSIGGSWSGGVYTFPDTIVDGHYLFSLQWTAASTGGASSAPSVTGSNCGIATMWTGDTHSVIYGGITGASDLVYTINFIVFIGPFSVPGFPATVTISGGTNNLVSPTGDVFITQIDADLVG